MNTSDLPPTTDVHMRQEPPDPEDRLGEAMLALVRARDAGDRQQVEAILEQYADLREQLQEMLDLESFFGLDRSTGDPLRLVADTAAYQKYDSWEQKSSGAYGMVFKAHDRVLGRSVAIKLFKPDLANKSALIRFLEEPQVASQLDHPGVAPIHELGRMPDGRPYVVMKWVEGQTLAELLEKKRWPAELPRFLSIFQQICQTVAYAHKVRGVLHRDLKPANVMVGSFGEVLVVDWGLSKVLLASDEGAETERVPMRTLRTQNPEMVTQDGAGIGTWAYMAPEQACGKTTEMTPRSDVFGLGAILCEILTGQPPYRHRSVLELVRAAENADLTDAFARLDTSGAEDELIALAKNCLAPRPEDRPANAREVADRITTYLDGVQTRAQREAVENATLRERLSALRWRVVAGVVFGLAATSLIGGAAWYRFEENARRTTARVLLEQREKDARERLDRVEAALKADRKEDARADLASALARLAEGGLEELQTRAESARRELAMLDQLERLRQHPPVLSDGMSPDDSGAVIGYGRAFRDHGIDLGDREAAIQAIRASPIRAQLLAALDHWALIEAYPGTRRKLLLIAQEASATDWGRRFRNPELRRNPAALARLAGETSPEQCSPVEIDSLARALLLSGRDAEALLQRGLSLYPSDFRLNLMMVSALERKAQKEQQAEQGRRLREQAIGYVRAALAVRPRNAAARDFLGCLLLECGRFPEAVTELKRAMQDRPRLLTRYALARALLANGDVREAENICQEALRLAPHEKRFHELLKSIRARESKR